MRIIDEADAIRRPALRQACGIVKLLDDRRRFLIFFYGLFLVLMLVGVGLCIFVVHHGGEPLAVGVMYFGFVGGVMGYITLRRVAWSRACWFYPEERLIHSRKTCFGLCVGRKWIDVGAGQLVVEPARMRGTRTTRNPFAWIVFLALIPLGVLGWLLGLAMERQVLLDASAICVRDSDGRTEMVVVLASTGDAVPRILSFFASEASEM